MSSVEELFKRDYRNCRYGWYYNGYRCQRGSNWNYWGRWVLAAICIILFVLILCCCLITRRRRSRGVKPMYGTGWMANGNKRWGNQNNHQMHNYGHQQQGYNQGGYNDPNQQQYGYGPPPPPPAYGQQQPQYTGTTFNPNDGYYGQNSGVQAPQGTYQRDDPYSAPAGPPPGK